MTLDNDQLNPFVTSGLEKTLCKWEVHVALVTTGLMRKFFNTFIMILSGFGGLEVAFGTQVHEFAPSRSRRIFRAKKSSACLPLEGK
jgi:hypothetical protein